MTAYVALLRAVNLGPHNKLPMAELKRICEEAGFAKVETFIASGNVVFASTEAEGPVKKALEWGLASYAGKPVGVLVRTARELGAIIDAFPFKQAAGNRGVVIFLDGKPPADTLNTVSGRHDEEVALGEREIYVAYGEQGIGRSKLKIPAAAEGTARNMNSVTKLHEMATEL